MTNKYVIMGLGMLSVILLAIASFYIHTSVYSSTNDLQSYSARKEDMLSSQQKIESMLSELNLTLQNEIDRQNVLSAELAALEKAVNLTNSSIVKKNTTTVKKTNTVPVTPKPVYIPKPVTRAS